MRFTQALIAVFAALQYLQPALAAPVVEERAVTKTTSSTTKSTTKSTKSTTTTTSPSKTSTTTTKSTTTPTTKTSSTTKSTTSPTSITTTTRSSSSTTSASSTTTTTAAVCNSGPYKASDGVQYTVQCSYNYNGGGNPNNILADQTGVTSLGACIDLCEGQSGCTAVDWYATSQGSGPNQVAGNCFLLSDTSLGGGSANGVHAATKPSNIDSTCTSGLQKASDGTTYNVQCGYNYNGGGSPNNILADKTGVASLSACLDLCESQAGCNAVDFYSKTQGSGSNQVAGNCFLLANVGQGGGTANGVNAAVKSGGGSTTTTTSTLVVSITSTTITSTSIAPTTTTTTTSVLTTTTSTAPTTTSTTTASITSTTTASSTTASSTSSTTASTTTITTSPIVTTTTTTASTSAACSQGTYTASDGAQYSVLCGTSYNGNGGAPGVNDQYISTVSNVPSVGACAEACEAYTGSSSCVAADFDETNQLCYLLSGTDNGMNSSPGGDAVSKISGPNPATTTTTPTSSASSTPMSYCTNAPGTSQYQCIGPDTYNVFCGSSVYGVGYTSTDTVTVATYQDCAGACSNRYYDDDVNCNTWDYDFPTGQCTLYYNSGYASSNIDSNYVGAYLQDRNKCCPNGPDSSTGCI